MQKYLIILAAFAALTGNCASIEARGSKKHHADSEGVDDWQSKLSQELANEKFNQAWGMFSTSGTEDRGQYIVLAYKDQKAGAVRVVPVNGKAIEKSFDVKKTTWTNFTKAMSKAKALKDLTQSFDGVRFEYVEWQKDAEGKISVKQRLVMVNPSLSADGKEHQKLIEAFRALK